MASAGTTVRAKRREPIDLSGAHIPGMSLSHADLANSDFSHANLTEVNFGGSDLHNANFEAATLIGANFTGADLSGANFTSADLVGTVLTGAKLDDANLTRANLSGALFEGVGLSRARGLSWTQLLDARFDKATVLPEYLEEEELFRLLEQAYPRRPWRDEFSGRIKDLLMVLVELPGRGSRSIDMHLSMIEAEIRMQEQEERKRDE